MIYLIHVQTRLVLPILARNTYARQDCGSHFVGTGKTVRVILVRCQRRE